MPNEKAKKCVQMAAAGRTKEKTKNSKKWYLKDTNWKLAQALNKGTIAILLLVNDKMIIKK